MTRVISRNEPLFQSIRLRFASRSTLVIRFSSGSLIAILKNTVRVRSKFNKNRIKPVYKTPVRFESLVAWQCYEFLSRKVNQARLRVIVSSLILDSKSTVVSYR